MKTGIMKCLKKYGNSKFSEPETTAVIIDGPAVVHMTKPGKDKNFHEYSKEVFKLMIMTHLKKLSRVDVIFD